MAGSSYLAVDELSEFMRAGVSSQMRDQSLFDVLNSEIFKAWLDERRPSTSGAGSSGSAVPTSGLRKRTAAGSSDQSDGPTSPKRKCRDASVGTSKFDFRGSPEAGRSVSGTPPPPPPPPAPTASVAAVDAKERRENLLRYARELREDAARRAKAAADAAEAAVLPRAARRCRPPPAQTQPQPVSSRIFVSFSNCLPTI
jgi:hypothetical protein